MNVKKALWQSVDVKVRKNRCLWLLVIMLGLIVLQAVFSFELQGKLPLLIRLPIMAVRLYCEIRILIDLWKILRMILRHKKVIFGECVLSEVGCANGHYYFRVKVKTAEGFLECCTNSIYSDTSTHAGYDDWKNKRVIAAYDPDEEIAIVIGEATEELRQLLLSQ